METITQNIGDRQRFVGSLANAVNARKNDGDVISVRYKDTEGDGLGGSYVYRASGRGVLPVELQDSDQYVPVGASGYLELVVDITKPVFFDTVADMLASSRVKDGQLCVTSGYNTANDGAAGKYVYSQSSETTPDVGLVLPGSGGSVSLNAAGVFDGDEGFGRHIAVDMLVADVRRFGAKGDGVTDDTKPIRAAALAAYAMGDRGLADSNYSKSPGVLFFPQTKSGNYRITDKITVLEGVDVHMESQLLYDSAVVQPAMEIGDAAKRNYNVTLKGLAAQRVSELETKDREDVAIRLINSFFCDIEIKHVLSFSVGVRGEGLGGNGFTYNNVRLINIRGAHIGVHLLSQTGAGWTTENLFIGGEFAGSRGLGGLAYGIYAENTGSGFSINDNNYFLKPSFELNPASGVTAYAVRIDGGTGFTIEKARIESLGAGTMKAAMFADASQDNYMSIASGGSQFYDVDDTTPARTNIVQPMFDIGSDKSKMVWQSESLSSNYTYYDGTNIHFPGVCTSNLFATTVSPFTSLATINSSNITMPSGQGLGRIVDTTRIKKFVVSADSSSVGYWFRCYDADGNLLAPGGVTQYAFAKGIVGSASLTTYYTSATSRSVMVTFADAVKSAAIFVADGTFDSFSIGIFDSKRNSVTTKPGYAEPVINGRMAIQAPTAGTYSVGTVVYNATPSPGAAIGWVCTAAGTPGTWDAIGDVAPTLDGTTSVVLNNATPHVGATEDFAIEASILRSGSGTRTIYSQDDGSAGGIRLELTASHHLQFFFRGQFALVSTSLVPATWSTVKVERVGSTFTLYIDGVARGTHTTAGSVLQVPNEIASYGGTNGFVGSIDYVSVVSGGAKRYDSRINARF